MWGLTQSSNHISLYTHTHELSCLVNFITSPICAAASVHLLCKAMGTVGQPYLAQHKPSLYAHQQAL